MSFDIEKENVSYTFRYILKKVDSEDLFVFLRTGSMADHDAYVKVIQEDSEILSCIREYVCSYALERTAQVETIKNEEKKEGEMNV